ILDPVELEALHDAEPVAQRRSQESRAGGRPDQREGRQVQLDRARRRPLPDHDVELTVLHGRIEHLLDDRREAVDLVDEEHVARLQVGQDGREVPGTLQHGPRGLAQTDAELRGDDVGQCRLAESRWPEDEHMIERLGALARGADEDVELRLHLRLPDIFREPPRTDGLVYRLVLARGLGADRSFSLQFGITPAPRPSGHGGSALRWNVYPDPPP